MPVGVSIDRTYCPFPQTSKTARETIRFPRQIPTPAVISFVMILEVALLTVREGMNVKFEAAFREASSIISSMRGYISHELRPCLEDQQRYALLVQWQTLEDHTVGFRQSVEYQRWRQLLHHFYNPFPTVEHYGPSLI